MWGLHCDSSGHRAGAGTQIDHEGVCDIKGGEQLESSTHHDLGLRPRREDAGTNGQCHGAEVRPSGEVLKGDPLSTACHEVVKANGNSGIEVAPEAAPANSQKMGGEQLGIDARRGHPALGEPELGGIKGISQ
jgi:hypothetical protein